VVGIEIPNPARETVCLKDVANSDLFQGSGSTLTLAIGKDISGSPFVIDLARLPHLLVAGSTGSGKSVSINAMICSLLLRATPDEVKLLLIDPKMLELPSYEGIPHLLVPVVTDPKEAAIALRWMVEEMERRYAMMAEQGIRNIENYNQKAKEGLIRPAEGEEGVLSVKQLPYVLVVIDELADLMMLAPDETERTITRMAQLARATGIHMVISTQRPSVDVVTGLIKANFPARIAFATASNTDSRVILDQPGAERLLGRGDMLFQAPDAAAAVRLQGVFVSEYELLRLVQYWRGMAGYVAPSSVATAAGGIPDMIPKGVPLKQMPMFEGADIEPGEERDPLFDEAVDFIRREGRASISMLQRRLRIGYTRAARLIEMMEEKGIVSSPQPGAQMRDVLDYGPAAPPPEEED
jgi:S-DNA-T family DNA segregation ATPase FtsK/SpoIIIE